MKIFFWDHCSHNFLNLIIKLEFFAIFDWIFSPIPPFGIKSRKLPCYTNLYIIWNFPNFPVSPSVLTCRSLVLLLSCQHSFPNGRDTWNLLKNTTVLALKSHEFLSFYIHLLHIFCFHVILLSKQHCHFDPPHNCFF